MTILLNFALLLFVYVLSNMFLLLNGVDSPYPVLETQVLVLVLVLDTKVLVLVLASKVSKVLVLVPQVLVLVTKVLVNITVYYTCRLNYYCFTFPQPFAFGNGVVM